MESRLEKIKEMITVMDGDLQAQMMGMEINGQIIIDELKWLVDRQELALGELKELQKRIAPLKNEVLDQHLKRIIDLLEGDDN